MSNPVPSETLAPYVEALQQARLQRDEAVQGLSSELQRRLEAEKEVAALKAQRQLSADREWLGKLVRLAWVRWAQTQPDAKGSWLVPWEELSERDKEADRQIGEFIASQCVSPELLRVEAERDALKVKVAEAEKRGKYKLERTCIYLGDGNKAIIRREGSAAWLEIVPQEIIRAAMEGKC